MGRYSFSIEVFFAQNDFLDIDEEELKLFEVEGKEVILISLEKTKKISDSKGMKVFCGMFEDINKCLEIAKKIYTNLLISLNNSDISYYIDKKHRGNFIKYSSDKDRNLYKEIIINDKLDNSNNMKFVIENIRCGCTHFRFDKLFDLKLDKKLKDSIVINNYRKYLLANDMTAYVDNTLFSAALEMLLDKEEREQDELDIITELGQYLDDRFKDTKNEKYNKIKSIIMSLRYKSINDKKIELIKKHSTIDEVNENVSRIKEISNNRRNEIHDSSDKSIPIVFSWNILNKIQFEYAKKLKNNDH